MAEITLADYAGYIFREMIKAREMADTYSRLVAEQYARDAVLKYFSVPRFKVPSMQLTIPVLISGARFAQSARFTMDQETFRNLIMGQVKEVLAAVRRAGGVPVPPRKKIGGSVLDPRVPPLVAKAEDGTLAALVDEFWQELRDNPDPTQPVSIVQQGWAEIFERALADNKLDELRRKTDPENALLKSSTVQILQKVNNNTAIESTRINSLLVNPETQVVKDGSSEASVFVIRADMTEEGFYIHSVKDEETGQSRPVVEFE